MGMFDHINVEMPCPNCGNILNGFQSKDHNCVLQLIDPDNVDYFYDSCDQCGRRTVLRRDAKDAAPPREKPFSREECEALGFEVSC